MHLRHAERHAKLTAWLDTPRSRRALLLLRVTMLAILCGAPPAAAQAGATTPAGLPGTPARIAPPPPVPVTTTSAVTVPPYASPPLNTDHEDELEDRGVFIDTLKSVLDGRSPSQGPMSASTAPVPTPTHPAQAADMGQRIARVTASPAWKLLEILSLAFALGIGAAAAYFSTHRGSETSD